MITKEEVLKFQNDWSDGIIQISNSYKNGGDFINDTLFFIDNLYAYANEEVLFKPTLVFDKQFRLDKKGALSYFVGNDSDFLEDKGFAIKGWTEIRWENAGFKFFSDTAVCMGNYFFTIENNDPLKVEYTIVLKKINGVLKLILHDSHLPYQQ